jgi:LPXTG-site transpeptidase (sortase) family protein
MRKFSVLTFIILGAIILGSVAVFATTLTHALVSAPAEEEIDIPELNTHGVASSSLPVRLSIPSLEVDVQVQHVGISKRGNMAVPTNYTDVGWYKYGALPGAKGSAVIAGHLDNGFGQPGVFKRLTELQVGDEVIVTDQEGNRLYFEVTHFGKLESTTENTEDVFADVGEARLNLVTCEGEWIPEIKSYAERRIVYTILQHVEPVAS